MLGSMENDGIRSLGTHGKYFEGSDAISPCTCVCVCSVDYLEKYDNPGNLVCVRIYENLAGENKVGVGEGVGGLAEGWKGLRCFGMEELNSYLRNGCDEKVKWVSMILIGIGHANISDLAEPSLPSNYPDLSMDQHPHHYFSPFRLFVPFPLPSRRPALRMGKLISPS